VLQFASHLSPDDGSNRIIQGLWIGSQLSTMERLSIASFLQNGHEYHLYTYAKLQNVPAGTIIKEAREILPASAVFQYKERPSFAGFSNFFRYKLLLEKGGWWADTDVACLRPFDFEDEVVFASELANGQETTTSCIIKAPVGSEAMSYAWSVCKGKDPNKLVWGETGPHLMSEVVSKLGLKQYQKPYETFCPIVGYEQLFVPYLVGIPEGAYAIHLWNAVWNFYKTDKDAAYHPGCIYELLKSRYL
jgi:Glycosyltransferase sugar-binding region containing DXD motif